MQKPTLHSLRWRELDPAARSAALARPAIAIDGTVQAEARAIIERVRQSGDRALLELSAELDDADVTELAVSSEELDHADSMLTASQSDAIDLAIANVSAFHEQQRPTPFAVETMPGVRCERICQPLDSVGLYVPAGSAPLPSTAIMLAVPAAIAACPRQVLCTPPQRDGSADAAVLAVARRTGISTVFKVGGAQAIAALAYGTESVPRVAKIFGPGNAWVTAAKTAVSADVNGAAIDMPAGPSEVLVIADDSANPVFVAADLLSQAEHGADSQVLLITPDESLANAVLQELAAQLAKLGRKEIAARALAHARILLAEDLRQAVDISNRYAPEHLIIQTRDARSLLADIRNAGSVFLGPWTPEAVGDYASGTNHVLPTYGSARAHSGLGLDQFMRYMTVQELTREGLADISSAVLSLAHLEGLDAHAEAVRCRLSRDGNER